MREKINIEKPDNFYEIINPSEEDICRHIDETKKKALEGDLFALEELADIMVYYGQYDMAERLYNRVIELDENPKNEFSRASFAYVGLGDLYLNNYIGNCDYQLAYSNYLKANVYGNIIAKERIAFMYKNGIGFSRDYDKYVEIIMEIYKQYKKIELITPEIWYEMALIKYNNKEYDEAKRIIKIFDLGGEFSAINIFTIKKDVNNIINIRKLQYKLGLIDENEFDFYSIDALSGKNKNFSFKYRSKKYEVNVKQEGNIRYFELNGNKYKNLEDMILKCKIQNKTILEIIDRFTNYKAINHTIY